MKTPGYLADNFGMLEYSMPHFMVYRFGLFTHSTKTPGAYVDFDWFRIKRMSDQVSNNPGPAASLSAIRRAFFCDILPAGIETSPARSR